ncbi:MAG: phosphate transporter substrate-binding protein PstS [Frankiales bacterium]|nr:phosphate transporter substrate-binding protein PstS [Frankiales bacterium]
MTFRRLGRVLSRCTAVLIVLLSLGLLAGVPAQAASVYVPISGAGSTWSSNAIDQWRRNVTQYGMQVNYNPTGSSDGRNQFTSGTVDFGVSEIPYGLTDNGVTDYPPKRGYAYMPIVAGGTSFMYNLKVGTKQVTNLRLSGQTLSKIFTGVITNWSDPAIKADNPGLGLPARKIVPVVRSDGSGTTAQFTTWMASQYPALWNAYCLKVGRKSPCGQTSVWPVAPGTAFTAQSGSTGTAGYVAQAQSIGAITYVEYSYALNSGFPVAKILNQAGYYTEPTAQNVAVALLKAKINDDPKSPNYLTQDLTNVYVNPDPRTYPLSSYSYMIIPTKIESKFTTNKGYTLGAFSYYFLCEGQQQAPNLGYSPLPINLVQAGLAQVRKIPGVDVQSVDIAKCNNPTFSKDGTNTLAKNAPQPSPCDKIGVTQCSNGTGGAKNTSNANTGTQTVASGNSTSGSNQADPANTPGGARTGSSGVAKPGAKPTKSVAAGSGAITGAPDPASDAGAAGTSDPAGDANALTVAAVPVALSANNGSATDQAMMAIAAAMLLLLITGPPLLVRLIRGRR